MADTSTATAPTADPKAAPAPTVPVTDRGGETKAFTPRPTREAGLKAGMETMERLEKAQHVVADPADAVAKQAQPEGAKEQARAKDGTFAPKTETPEKPDKAAPAKEASKFSEADREKAVTGLRRAKVPEKALEPLSEDERVQWGLDLARGQSENDRRVTESTKAKTQIADPALKPTGQPAPTGNLRGLSEDLGLDDIGHSKLEAAFSERDTRLTAQETQIAELNRGLIETHMEHAFGELAKEIPELATDEGRKALAPRVLRMAQTGDYDSIHPRVADQLRECVRDAAGIEFREAIAERQAARAKSARRDAGQLTPPTPGKLSKPANKKEWAMVSMDLLENHGMSPDEVKARLGG